MKKKKKHKAKKSIRRAACLAHRLAISLHAEAETLQQKTRFLVAALDELLGGEDGRKKEI